MAVLDSIEVGLAAETFIATALLHREHSQRADFTIKEIVNRAARENLVGELRSGLNVHASQHCVANRPPNPAKHRMLFATGKHTRRLLLPGDEINSARTGKIFPDEAEIPERYLTLLAWARERYEKAGEATKNERTTGGGFPVGHPSHAPETSDRWLGALFELEGLGKEHWKNVDPDEFVRKLREGWK